MKKYSKSDVLIIRNKNKKKFPVVAFKTDAPVFD